MKIPDYKLFKILYNNDTVNYLDVVYKEEAYKELLKRGKLPKNKVFNFCTCSFEDNTAKAFDLGIKGNDSYVFYTKEFINNFHGWKKINI